MNIACICSVVDYVLRKKPLVNQQCIPMGIASIATVLQQAGHDIVTLVFSPVTPIATTVRDFIVRTQPRLCCLSAVSTQFPVMRAVAESIKAVDPSIYVIIGGPHASLNPEATMSHKVFDAVCISEGEQASVELAAQLAHGISEPSGIPNLWLRTLASPDGIERNSPRPFIEDLANIPSINRELWVPHVADINYMPSILLGRGCPYRCTYCSNHAMAKLATGRYVRLRPISQVIDELRAVTLRFPNVQAIFFEVETLGADVGWTITLCNELTAFNRNREKPLRFGSNLAAGRHVLSNEQLFNAFNKANFTFMNIGLESGSERIRDEILRRPQYSNAEIITFCEKLRWRGINVNLFVLIGIPTETPHDWQKTIDVIRACQPQFVLSSIFHPYPGTDLHHYSQVHGLLSEKVETGKIERRSSFLRLPGFSPRRIQREYLLLPWGIFHDRWPKHRVIAQIVKNYISLNPRLDAFCRYLFNSNSVMRMILKRLSNYNN
ncbi:MAG: radical SAM protein [Proteobacteria bacterium]|nr:radical SAM protein [Pseudomonadota bacterium]